MIYPKTYLEQLIKDAIECYRSMVVEGRIPRRRELQIQMLQSLCQSVQYDAMLLIRVKKLVTEIDLANSIWLRWLFVPRSKLSIVLEEAIDEYEKALEILEGQVLEKGKVGRLLNHTPSSQSHDVSQQSLVCNEPDTLVPVVMPHVRQLMQEARDLCAIEAAR